jgi:D-alanyl-D-alanine carboxypeptidase/D-alanyl-D-alanine carboxypeptidase (penicillin-binding protein 5/6)
MKKITIILIAIISLSMFTALTAVKIRLPFGHMTCSALTDTRTVSVALPAPEISAVSAIVIDAESGKVLFAKNCSEIRAIASLTKVMTTLLTIEAGIEAGDLDRQFTVDNCAIHVEGTSMGLLEGDIVTRRALCYGMMLPSGNDASNAAAVSVAGSVPEFVKLMNTRARQIGMSDSTFANPHGLDQCGHLSTARDMAILTRYALHLSPEPVRELFREICGSESVRLEFGNPPYRRWLKNNNKLLHMCEGGIGVKTGFTDSARRTLISASERDGATLIVVTLNAPDDWNDHIAMFDYGFKKMEMLYRKYC